jgi:SAM-dependent methyltransferase
LKPEQANGHEGFDPSLFEALYQIEPTHFWFRARNHMIVEMLRRYFPNFSNLLEIGCGTGFVLAAIEEKFPAAQLIGADYFTEAFPYARERLRRAALRQLDARNIEYVSQFDVIGMFDVLEHIDEDEQVLQQLHKACRPGGGILLTVPQHPFLWSQFDERSSHARRYTWAQISERVQRAGFTLRRVTSFNSLTLPAMLAARLKNSRQADSYNILNDFKINPAINEALLHVLNIERRLIQAGVNFPAGGSLLVVAYRS